MADRKEIAEKIKGAQNILVALSKDPSVDEVSAALGLTLMLDKIGKKATAIYSGVTPDVLKFLNPEKTFSTDTNALQDFIIALDKDKADHLRYKVDGDYVKVFITPYHEAISEDDLEYSYGDFNVDLIIALDVANDGDLDGALSEYGRIMHDAGAVNITTNEGGNFSDVQWSNPGASSVCEMVAELGADLGEDTFEKNSATALLTGIVASTERFANEKTTPETMGVASKLMAAGADQSLIAENIERAEEGKEQIMIGEQLNVSEPMAEPEVKPAEEPVEEVKEPEIEKPAEEVKEQEETSEEKPVEAEESAEVEEPTETEEPEPQKPVLETPSELLGDMPTVDKPAEEEKPVEEEKPAEPEATPEVKVETPELPKSTGPAPEDTTHKTVKLQPSAEAQAELEQMMKEEPKKNELLEEMNKESARLAEGGLKPDVGLSSIDTDNIGKSEVKDYGEMMAAALSGDDGMPNPAVQAAPAVASGPEANHIPEMDYSQPSTEPAEQPPVMQNGMLESVAPATEPAGAAHEGMMAATEVTANSESGMVQASEGMNGDILPPPPAPPVNGAMMPPMATPEAAPASAEPVVPAMPETPASVESTPVIPETPVAPANPEPAAPAAAPVTPVIPAAPAAAPETPATPEVPAAHEAPTQVGPTPTTDDPSAFRIPGM
ncbi:MAG: hypothetical protein Q4A25_00130 [Candidatus Saccharibacteria bacterium]|nr:hypothetical protein [Candidatus Saccharibacteria bacterium]